MNNNNNNELYKKTIIRFLKNNNIYHKLIKYDKHNHIFNQLNSINLSLSTITKQIITTNNIIKMNENDDLPLLI